jgi:hypothetical protein
MGGFFIACNLDDQFSEDTVNDAEIEMRKILGEHLTVENNRYVLDLSEADAIASGVSQSLYTKFLSEIAKSNAFIESTENDPNISVSFDNNREDNHSINYKPVRLKDGNENDGWTALANINLTSATTSVIRTIPAGTYHVLLKFKTNTYSVPISYTITGGGVPGGSSTGTVNITPNPTAILDYSTIPQIASRTWTFSVTKSSNADTSIFCWVEIYCK